MAQRFHRILGDALQIGLETVVNKKKSAPLLAELERNGQLAGFSVRDPNARGDKPDAQTLSVTHFAIGNGVGVLDLVYFGKTMVWEFASLPEGLQKEFQRINLKRDLLGANELNVLSLLCGRFNINGLPPETKPFEIRLNHQDPEGKVGYLNLDFLSRTPVWNPLFARCRLVARYASEKAREFVYLKIDACVNERNNVVVTISQVSEDAVPEFLKPAAVAQV